MNNLVLFDSLYVASCFGERYQFWYYTRRGSNVALKYCLELRIFGLDRLLFEKRMWFFKDKEARQMFMRSKIALYNKQHVELSNDDLR